MTFASCDILRSPFGSHECRTCGVVAAPGTAVACPRGREAYGSTALQIVAGLRRRPEEGRAA